MAIGLHGIAPRVIEEVRPTSRRRVAAAALASHTLALREADESS